MFFACKDVSSFFKVLLLVWNTYILYDIKKLPTPTILKKKQIRTEENLKRKMLKQIKYYPVNFPLFLIIFTRRFSHALECTGKPYLLKAQHCAFNISDSTTIPLTVQNWQITSFVPDSTDFVVDSSNKCLAVRTVGMQRCPGFHKNVKFCKMNQ